MVDRRVYLLGVNLPRGFWWLYLGSHEFTHDWVDQSSLSMRGTHTGGMCTRCRGLVRHHVLSMMCIKCTEETYVGP